MHNNHVSFSSPLFFSRHQIYLYGNKEPTSHLFLLRHQIYLYGNKESPLVHVLEAFIEDYMAAWEDS